MEAPSKDHDPYYGTQVLVLGATGCIGSWVARSLCARGSKLSLVVRDKEASERVFSFYNIRGDVFVVDVENLEAVAKLLHRIKPSITFNLAGYGMDPPERDPRPAYQINVDLLDVLLETIAERQDKAWPGQRIVHVGSQLEYGAIGGNLSEDAIPKPNTLYGKSKLAGTELLTRFCRNYNFKGLTARPFTVYGPGESDRRLLPSLIKTAITRRPLQLTSGEQKRDFIYVEDVSEALVRLGIAPAAPGDIVNLATGCLTSVRDFVETAARILKIPEDQLRFGELPALPEEMHHSEVATERLRRLTGWAPSTMIEEGIRKTIAGIPSPHSPLTVFQAPR